VGPESVVPEPVVATRGQLAQPGTVAKGLLAAPPFAGEREDHRPTANFADEASESVTRHDLQQRLEILGPATSRARPRPTRPAPRSRGHAELTNPSGRGAVERHGARRRLTTPTVVPWRAMSSRPAAINPNRSLVGSVGAGRRQRTNHGNGHHAAGFRARTS
jgi:hypothetical protein